MTPPLPDPHQATIDVLERIMADDHPTVRALALELVREQECTCADLLWSGCYFDLSDEAAADYLAGEARSRTVFDVDAGDLREDES